MGRKVLIIGNSASGVSLGVTNKLTSGIIIPPSEEKILVNKEKFDISKILYSNLDKTKTLLGNTKKKKKRKVKNKKTHLNKRK